MKALLVMLLLAACGDPPPMVLKFRVTDGDVQACTSSTGTKASTCEDVTMLCDSYASIRIFAPSDPTAPFVSACKPLAEGATTKTLCSIAQVPLPAPAMPVSAQTLEIDMAVYAKDSLHTDPMGNLICPSEPAFGADGFPVLSQEPCTDPDMTTCDAQPAIGGRAFYHPGDTETVISLGCTNLAALEDRMCAGQSLLTVSATVNDFDTSVSVSPTTADGLTVSIGEPTSNGSVFTLSPSQAHALDRLGAGPVPAWSGNFDLELHNAACLDVLEDGAQSTPVLTCTNNVSSNHLDLLGVRLSTATLNQILAAVRTQFPAVDLGPGLVVGRVLDYLGTPKPNVTIVASDTAAHILYLSDDATSLVPGATSRSGIWVSTDAKFGTTFTTTDIAVLTQPGFGGLVQQKVDVVVLQFKPPGTGG